MKTYNQATHHDLSSSTNAASDGKKQRQSLTDQHAGAYIPTATQQTAIQNVLNPTSAGSGAAMLPWNGAAQPDGCLTLAKQLSFGTKEVPRGKKKTVDCTLTALANGRLQDWSGIQPTFSRTDAQKAFGPSKSDCDNYGLLGGSPTAFREYFPTPAAPLGITVWYVDEQMVLIRLLQPKLAESLTQMLGVSEATIPSQLQRFHTQWIYAQRGLTAHVHNATGEILRLYAYHPTSTREFLNSWLSRVHIRRIPLRR